MSAAMLRTAGLVALAGLTAGGCQSGSNTSTPAPAEAASPGEIRAMPAGWDEVVAKSGELYGAAKYAESIAVLDAFAAAHPTFSQVHIHLGDSWLMERDELGPLPVRLAKFAAHYRRALELSVDDFDRRQAINSLLRVYRRQVLGSASLPAAEQRELMAAAGSFADEVLKGAPQEPDALEIKSMIAEANERLKE